MMKFPYKPKDKGCKELVVLNRKYVLECAYRDEEKKKMYEERGQFCCVCTKDISVLPRYECPRGHKICSLCISPFNFRCQLCKTKITTDLIYICQFKFFGCGFQSDRDTTIRHETDCSSRDYTCPFSIHSCKWKGSLRRMSEHLKNTHFEETILDNETLRTFNLRDDSWVMVAYGETFQCYCWVGEYSVEWLVKYIGPQERSTNFSCEVRLSDKFSKHILKMSNKCHGWNNISLEKCIELSVDDMIDKYLIERQCTFKFKILKNN